MLSELSSRPLRLLMLSFSAVTPGFDYGSIFSTAMWSLAPVFVLVGLLIPARLYLEVRSARKRKAAEPPPLALEAKMLRLAELTGDAGKLNAEVQAEILLAQSATIKLKKDAEEAGRIAALSSSERDAVASLVSAQMSAELGKSAKSDRRSALLFNIAFFAAGVLVTLFVPPLWQ
jgi:hypothetical protein